MSTSNSSSKSSSSPERPDVLIQRLPPELLGAIFQFYVESFDVSEPENLGLVCRLWYDITISQGMLWRFIILNPAVLQQTPYQSLHAYVRNRILRSRSCPLAIRLTGNMDDPDDYETALCLLLETVSRWEELWLTYGDIARQKTINLLLSLTAPTPVLRTIQWRSDHPLTADYSIILPSTPCLSRIDIKVGNVFRLPQSICASARTVSIASQNLTVFQNMVSQFQNLQHLILPSPGHLEALFTSPNPITLPSVRKLTIKGRQSTDSRLMALKLPSLGTLEVDVIPEAYWPVQRKVWIRKLQDLLPTVHTTILRNIHFGNQSEFRALLKGGLQVKRLVCSGVGQRPYVDPTNLSGGTLDTLVDIIDVLRSMT